VAFFFSACLSIHSEAGIIIKVKKTLAISHLPLAKRAGSSAVEQEPFKLLVTGSNPVRLTHKKAQYFAEFFSE
jgi:hypothetical protein